MEGATIGTYRLVHKLGEGGMGEVWMGEHTLIGRRAAIKLLLPSPVDQPGGWCSASSTRRAPVTAIADPGIVQVFDFGVHADTQAFIVMELLDGESLDARIRRVGRLSPLDAARLVRQVASSLSAVHAKGVIHRDLKPENLFIVGDPAVTGGERTKDPRLRHRQARRRRAVQVQDPHRGDDGHAGVHVARAVPRHGVDRPSDRPVLARRRAVRHGVWGGHRSTAKARAT
jgi:hypothetical protein